MQCRNISIRLNSTGEDVKKLQNYLKACKYYTGNIDGVCGSYMVESIKLLQKNQGNMPDGVFGPKTCKKTDLNKQLQNNHSPPQNKKTKEASELLIKYKKQPDIISCGPTSLSMCYSYYNHDYSIQYLKKLCNTGPHGTSPNDLINATTKADKNYKLIEEDYEGFKQIIKHIDNYNPIIIQLQTIPELGYYGSYGHYVALTGYNRKSQTLKIADPSRTISWFIEPIIRRAIKKRLSLGRIKPIKILKKTNI